MVLDNLVSVIEQFKFKNQRQFQAEKMYLDNI